MNLSDYLREEKQAIRERISALPVEGSEETRQYWRGMMDGIDRLRLQIFWGLVDLSPRYDDILEGDEPFS